MKKISALFFILYFIVGLFIFKDYGINWDEVDCRLMGIKSWDYVLHNDRTVFHKDYKYHGPAMEMVLVCIEKGLGLSDPRNIFLCRHLLLFFTCYLAVIAFFLSAKTIFLSEPCALLAAALLVLSPRVFANFFYDSKDMAFLAFYIFSFYAVIKLSRRLNFLWLLLFCLSCGFATDIRILGIIFVSIAAFVLLKGWFEYPVQRKRILLLILLFPIMMASFIVLFWPVLWQHPRYEFIQAFTENKRFPWPGAVTYLGQALKARNLPWHYLPVWIMISSPVIVTLFWFVGMTFMAKDFIKRPVTYLKENADWAFVVFLCIAPVMAVIILKSTIYDAWRHVFFIYPFIILIVVYGLRRTAGYLTGIYKNIAKGAMFLYLLAMCGIIMQMHPFENDYFNLIALKCFNPIDKNFDMDYWGLSYKQGLEDLIKTHPDMQKIKIISADKPGFDNSFILSKNDRDRLDYKNKMADADFYITINRGDSLIPTGKIILELKSLGSPILDVYKLRDTN